jgi:hypothetical protein
MAAAVLAAFGSELMRRAACGGKHERFDGGDVVPDRPAAGRGVVGGGRRDPGEATPLNGSAPRVLVGGTYLDASTGLLVRVLDSKRSMAGPTGSFIVESASRARPGQRWVCAGKDLLEGGRRPA